MEDQHMAHVEEGALLAWLDDELEDTEREALEAHVATCEACARQRDALRFTARTVTAALEEIDAPSPWAEMPDTLREAAREAPIPLDPARSTDRGGRRSGSRAVATAAGLMFLLAAGAYAIPGSPVRGWVADSIQAIASLVGSDETPAGPGPSSVSVEPTDGSVRVAVIGATSDLTVSVSLSSDGRAIASALDASFGIETGRLEVRDVPAGELTVMLPSAVAEAVLEVDGVEVVRVEEGRLVRLPEADASAAAIVLQAGG